MDGLHRTPGFPLALLAAAFAGQHAGQHATDLFDQATKRRYPQRNERPAYPESVQGKILVRHKGQVVPVFVLQTPSQKAKKPLYTVRLENQQIIRVSEEQIVKSANT